MTNHQVIKLSDNIRRAVALCRTLSEKRGVHSVIYMSLAGSKYTNDGDTARCQYCALEVSNWAVNMNRFTIHSFQIKSSMSICSFYKIIFIIKCTRFFYLLNHHS